MNSTEWRKVPSLNNEYEVSNDGRVRSTTRIITDCTGKSRIFRGKNLAIRVGSGGYKNVGINISHPQKIKSYRVHRLVAEAFLPNPDNLKNVVFKDGNPSNCCVDNLMWSDGHLCKDGVKCKRSTIRPVIDLTTGRWYKNHLEAESDLGHKQLLRALQSTGNWYGHKFAYLDIPEDTANTLFQDVNKI